MYTSIPKVLKWRKQYRKKRKSNSFSKAHPHIAIIKDRVKTT